MRLQNLSLFLNKICRGLLEYVSIKWCSYYHTKNSKNYTKNSKKSTKCRNSKESYQVHLLCRRAPVWYLSTLEPLSLHIFVRQVIQSKWSTELLARKYTVPENKISVFLNFEQFVRHDKQSKYPAQLLRVIVIWAEDEPRQLLFQQVSSLKL